MKTKAVIFDLFHTLISFKTDGVPGLSTSDRLGVPEDQWNTLLFKQSENRLRGHIKDPVKIITELVELAGWDIPHEMIVEAATAREQRFAEGMNAARPHVLKALEKIRQSGCLVGLCSNADWMERAGWNGTSLSQLFDIAVFSCDVGYLKPEKQIYQICLDKLQVKAQDTIFVGDGGSQELVGARRMGMKTVLTTEILSRIWPGKIEQRIKDADHVIDNIEQIIDYI